MFSASSAFFFSINTNACVPLGRLDLLRFITRCVILQRKLVSLFRIRYGLCFVRCALNCRWGSLCGNLSGFLALRGLLRLIVVSLQIGFVNPNHVVKGLQLCRGSSALCEVVPLILHGCYASGQFGRIDGVSINSIALKHVCHCICCARGYELRTLRQSRKTKGGAKVVVLFQQTGSGCLGVRWYVDRLPIG